LKPIKRALISVSNKTGIVEFARQLSQLNIEIISTGGTHALLTSEKIPARQISEVTGFPEILDGRVKTLHPNIHGGILAVRTNNHHQEQLHQHHIQEIDLVVVNLYPFEETVAQPDIPLSDAIEQIDIGGPAMIRSASKNHQHVGIVVNPKRYPGIIEEITSNHGILSDETRLHLAAEAFAHTSYYDSVIAKYFAGLTSTSDTNPFAETLTLGLHKDFDLRYGENPHQQAAFYGSFSKLFSKLHGKELSYNNILDLDAAYNLLLEFAEPAIVIIKHTNPCGVGTGSTLNEAYQKALATDRPSAFGGIVAANRIIDRPMAELLNEIFLEIVIAPQYDPEALVVLTKKKDRRLLTFNVGQRVASTIMFKPVAAGYLAQTQDSITLDTAQSIRVVTSRAPCPEELEGLFFAWKIAKHVKSNAIIYALKDRTLGIGAGQMSRVDSSRIAVQKAQNASLSLSGCVMASDAFFPFADGLLEAVKAGATAVIQPGGSVRDQEVIQAANDNNIAMVFTGIRHFRH
jgi:phosphoribosylaminoimidazolecarboxamide formyltransferase/IMP cyclohydrolase